MSEEYPNRPWKPNAEAQAQRRAKPTALAAVACSRIDSAQP
jgi:hypothetical protein